MGERTPKKQCFGCKSRLPLEAFVDIEGTTHSMCASCRAYDQPLIAPTKCATPGCNKKTYDHRCPDCLRKWRSKNRVPVEDDLWDVPAYF